MDKQEKINELLSRRIEAVYPSEKFLRSRLEGDKKLTIYFGIDPTGPTLHLGHAMQLMSLRTLQDLGHQIIMLIGDFTAMIGDPTDKAAVRKKLTREQVLENCKKYKEQASKIIKFDGENPAILKFNSEWLGKMSFADVVELASNFTVQQLLERDNFEKRIKEGKPVYFHEFMYPLMQGYDSVCITEGGVDGEIGGSDQIFNMLAGRTLEKSLLDKEKFVLANKLFADPNGEKMGKTTGNMVALNQSPRDMFGAVMSWTDGMIEIGFQLCTNAPMSKVEEVKSRMESGENPKNIKLELAHTIVSFFFDDETAESAKVEFDNMFAKGGVPDEIPEVYVSEEKFTILSPEIVKAAGVSGSDMRRLVQGGGVKLNDEKIEDIHAEYQTEKENILKVGKRKFFKIIKK